jgi:hypothetical protein
MASSTKNKVIQVQRPAQSLQAFQKKVATGQAERNNLLKPLLISGGVLLGAGLLIFGARAWSASRHETFEADLASIQLDVVGDAMAPVPAGEIEKRMRESLPRLEALVKRAPGSERASAEGLLASWKLQLDGTGGIPAQTGDAWGRLRLAQKQVALGQGSDALTTLAALRKDADPSQAWASVFWSTLLDADRLKGDRDQALKDFAEYKERFKTQADPSLEHLLQGV